MSVESTRPTASSAPSPALHQVRDTAEALLAAGQVPEAVEFLLDALGAALRTNTDLALLVAQLRRGPRPSSERVSTTQLALLLEHMATLGSAASVPGDPEQETREAREDAATEREITEARQQAAREAAARPPNAATPAPRKRQEWHAPGLPSVRHDCAVSPGERTCQRCGEEMAVIGHEVTSRLELVPARFERHEYHREKRACGTCKQGVTTAAGAPPPVIEGSTVGASVLAQIVVGKFADHLPLTRQHTIYERDGLRIPVSTMSGWVLEVGARCAPLVDLLADRVRQAFLLQGDATGLPVLEPTHPANIQKGTLWGYVGDKQYVVFHYTPTGEAEEGPWRFLKGRTGYYQADASNVFDRVFNGRVATAIEVACHAHLRRKFVALQDVDSRVAYPIKQIARLYRIERLADARGATPEERRALRLERAPPILRNLQEYCRAVHGSEPPSSKLAQAAAYGLNHWQALTRFLEDGRLPLDNNVCEQQLRSVALTRNNALFAGSHEGARAMATILSLVRTCALQSVPPLAYFTRVLERLADGTYADHLHELLPDRWSALQVATDTK